MGGARAPTHYCSRAFENGIAHADGVVEACKAHSDIGPDLIVGHSAFGSTVFLPDLVPQAPVVNYFEYYYHPHGSDMDFRPEFAPAEIDFLRVRARNVMVLLDLVNCRSGYSPTHFQRELFPAELRHKIAVIFAGIETDVFRRLPDVPRCVGDSVGDRPIDPSTRVVTYVSRGFESMRGFDIFMKAAKRPSGSTSSIPTPSSSRSAAIGSATAVTRSTSGTRPSASTSWRRTSTTCRWSSSPA